MLEGLCVAYALAIIDLQCSQIYTGAPNLKQHLFQLKYFVQLHQLLSSNDTQRYRLNLSKDQQLFTMSLQIFVYTKYIDGAFSDASALKNISDCPVIMSHRASHFSHSKR